MLGMLGYSAEDRDLYKKSLEHYIWNHVLREVVAGLNDEEKTLLQERISSQADDAGAVPREIACLKGHACISDALHRVSQKSLELSLSQLIHHIPADKPEYRERLQKLADQLQPVRIDLTDWLKKNEFVKEIFKLNAPLPATRIKERAERLRQASLQKLAAAMGLPDMQQTAVEITAALAQHLDQIEINLPTLTFVDEGGAP